MKYRYQDKTNLKRKMRCKANLEKKMRCKVNLKKKIKNKKRLLKKKPKNIKVTKYNLKLVFKVDQYGNILGMEERLYDEFGNESESFTMENNSCRVDTYYNNIFLKSQKISSH